MRCDVEGSCRRGITPRGPCPCRPHPERKPGHAYLVANSHGRVPVALSLAGLAPSVVVESVFRFLLAGRYQPVMIPCAAAE
jgi:hypothetical protein